MLGAQATEARLIVGVLSFLWPSIGRPEPHEGAPHDGAPHVLRFADLAVDLATRDVRRGRRSIELTPTECALLGLFLRHPERVLTRSFIFTEVWGFDFGSTSNALTVCIGNLRRKTEAGGEPRLLHTVRGVGYVLRAS
jgi:two-component system response regulator MprA